MSTDKSKDNGKECSEDHTPANKKEIAWHKDLLYAVGPFLLIVGAGFLFVSVALGWIPDCERVFPLLGGLFFFSCGIYYLMRMSRHPRLSGKLRGFQKVIGVFWLVYAGLMAYPFFAFQFLDPCEQAIRQMDCSRTYACAERDLRKAEKQGADASCMSYGWGLHRFFEKDYASAVTLLRNALELDPELNDARYQLSRTYNCMGEEENAKAFLEDYLEHGGGRYSSHAEKALERHY